MRYNRDTERGILIDEIATQCANAVKLAVAHAAVCPVPSRLWDCRRGQWVPS